LQRKTDDTNLFALEIDADKLWADFFFEKSTEFEKVMEVLKKVKQRIFQ